MGVPTPTGVLQGCAAFSWDGSAWQPSGRAGPSVATPTGVLQGVAPFSWSGTAWTPAGRSQPGVATSTGVLDGVAVYTWNGSAWTPTGGGPSSSTPTGVLRGVAAFTWDGTQWQPAGQAGPDVPTPFGVLQGVAMFNWTGTAWTPAAGIPAGATLNLNFMTGTLDPLLTFTRASTGTYFDATGTMQTAAINAPRWDYDPVLLQSRGLLLEDQRTNSAINSITFAGYTQSQAALTRPAGTNAPDGSALTLVTEGTLSSNHSFYGGSFTTTAATWTYSVFIRAGTQRYISLRGNSVDAVPNLPWITFDTQTQTINANAYVTSSGFTALPGGTFRIWLTAPATATAASVVVAGSNVATAPGPTISTGTVYLGTSLTWYAWGLQAEPGAFPSSLITTTNNAAAVTRSIDQCAVPPHEHGLLRQPRRIVVRRVHLYRRHAEQQPRHRPAGLRWWRLALCARDHARGFSERRRRRGHRECRRDARRHQGRQHLGTRSGEDLPQWRRDRHVRVIGHRLRHLHHDGRSLHVGRRRRHQRQYIRLAAPCRVLAARAGRRRIATGDNVTDNPSYPWSQGDELFADELNAAIANAGGANGTSGAANVINYGADPTGVLDSTAAIRAAVATGRRVYIPRGQYTITDAITISTGQIVEGDGPRATLLTIPPGFNMSALGVFVLATSTKEQDVEIRDLWIRFSQPDFAGMARANITQYPAAINTVSGNRAKFINLQITNAWTGIVFDGGGAGFLDRVEISAYSIGLSFAATTPVLDITHISNFHFWNFDMTANQSAVAWDGVTTAAQIGRIDGLVASDWGIFRANVTISATAGTPGFYYMANIMMDGAPSTLTISNSFVFEGVNFHFAHGAMEKSAIIIQGGRNSFTNTAIQSSMVSTPAIQVAGGSAAFNGGTPWWKENAGCEFVSVTGGACYLEAINFATHVSAHTAPFVHQSGTGILAMNNCSFPITGSGVALQMDTVVNGNFIGASNNYGAMTVAGAAYVSSATLTNLTAQTINATSQPTATTAQLTTRGGAAGVNGVEGKLRLHASFATGSDYGSYLAASLRGGWTSNAWNSSYLDVWLTSATNGTSSDANTTRVARFDANGVGVAKVTAAAAAPGAGFARLAFVAGTTAGTAKLVAYAGTSATPVTIVDNIGAGF